MSTEPSADRRRMDERLLHDLTCPITLELFEDPVTVPCCGKAFSRDALQDALTAAADRCPSCNGDLSGFDVETAARNVLLAGMVETIRDAHPNVDADGTLGEAPAAAAAATDAAAGVDGGRGNQPTGHVWGCTAQPVAQGSTMHEVTLTLEDGAFASRPSLFVAVLDRSGSMSGRPGEQVLTALKHIHALAKTNPQTHLLMLSYGSDCQEITNPNDYKINGGTNFRSAFKQIDQVLRRYRSADVAPVADDARIEVGSVHIAFLTDGQDGCSRGDRANLVPEFREILQTRWPEGPLAVHAIGFSRECDAALLEGMRTAGSIEGVYRYADYDDDDDALCNKLTGIFEVSSKSGSAPLSLQLAGETHEVQFPVALTGNGTHRLWVDLDDADTDVVISSSVDKGVHVPMTRVVDPDPAVLRRWVSRQTDSLAAAILERSQQGLSPKLRTLASALLATKIEALRAALVDDDATAARLDTLETQTEQLRLGNTVDVGRLRDLRFGSLFEPRPKHQQPAPGPKIFADRPRPPKPIKDEAHFERRLKHYTRALRDDRNELQNAICAMVDRQRTHAVKQLIEAATDAELAAADDDGNTALHLAAYCGHNTVVIELLKRLGNAVDLELANNDGETAASLAIKKRGFHHTLGALLDAGASIPRAKSMERFAIDEGYTITAKIIAGCGSGSLDIDSTMSEEYIRYVYARAIGGTKKWNRQNFLDLALEKKMVDMAEELMRDHKALPTIDMLVARCIPNKPDHPDTASYLALAKMVLDVDPSLIHAVTKPDRESALFAAARKGSLPHVQYFLSLGAKIDEPNHKGNTPLWCACFMQFPCIIEELLDAGADIMTTNLKGNGVLYGPATRGSRKVAELLVSRGAPVDHVNANGDTIILLCCRNGQQPVLEFLLSYVDEEFLNFKAHIDGFNAIMACAEQDRADCMRVLHENGVSLEQKTDDDNAIYAGATPLHIACFYSRVNALQMALQLGANPNAVDASGQTPLHVAVIQGNRDAIRLLRNAGADPTIRDSAGMIPMAYARDREDVRRMLTDPVLDILLDLAQGGFGEDEAAARAMLLGETGIPGCLDRASLVNVHDHEGSSPLIHAVLCQRLEVVKVLIALGANPTDTNHAGMNAAGYAVWARNRRLATALGVPEDAEPCPGLARLQELAGPDRAALFLGPPPAGYQRCTQSGIGQRMEGFINCPATAGAPTTPPSFAAIKGGAGALAVIREEGLSELEAQVWSARLRAIDGVARGEKRLGSHEAVALALWTNNGALHNKINTAILAQQLSPTYERFAGCLCSALRALPVYQGEVFVGSSTVDRKLYTVGTEFTWPHFASASTLWKVALENAPSFTSKARKGVVFAIKSTTGKLVGTAGQFVSDAEVIFAPQTRFRVTAWYHGDVIALGQANIREHSFGVKEVDDERAPLAQLLESEKSLIIELEEVQ